MAAERDRQSLFHLDFLLAQLRAYRRCRPGTHAPCLEEAKLGGAGAQILPPSSELETEGLPEPSRFDPAGLTTANIEVHTRNEAMVRYCKSPLARGLVCGGLPRPRKQPRLVGSQLVDARLPGTAAQHRTRPGPMGALLIALGLAAKEPANAVWRPTR